MRLEYLLAWLPMVPLAIGNAGLRESLLRKHLSELRAHQVSTLTCAGLLGVYMGVILQIWPLDGPITAAQVGALWLVLTLAFEFLAGHYLFKTPWSRILHDYDLVAGRVWPLLLLWIFLFPPIFFELSWGN